MGNRDFSKCVRCGKTIDVTNFDIDLCEECSKINEVGDSKD